MKVKCNTWHETLGAGLALFVAVFLNSCGPQDKEEVCTSLAILQSVNKVVLGTSRVNEQTDTIINGGSLILYNAAKKNIEKRIDVNSSVYRMAVSPDGLLIALNRGIEAISIMDTDLDKRLTEIAVNGVVNDLAFSRDSKLLAVAISRSDEKSTPGVLLYDCKTKKAETLVVDSEYGSRAVCFSCDGKWLLCGFKNGVKVWDIAKKKWGVEFMHGVSNSITCSHDGKYAASGSLDRTVKVWDLSTRESVLTLGEFKKALTKVEFSPKETILASLCVDDTIQVYNVKKKEIIKVYSSADTIHDFTFFPTGNSIIVTRRKDIELWEFNTGKTTLHKICP